MKDTLDLIDGGIEKFSGQKLADTSVVVDLLLDIRNHVEKLSTDNEEEDHVYS